MNRGRYGRQKVSAEVGTSPTEVRKVSEVIGSGREACESQEGCGSPNMASGSKPNALEELGSLRKSAEAKSRSGM